MAGSRSKAWQFWRKAFWTRAALLALYSVLVPALGLLTVVAAWSHFQDARGMADAERCAGVGRSASVDQDCLLEVRGWLDGPRYSRGPGSDWAFVEGADAHEVQVGSVGSRSLEDVGDAPVTGLLWHGELVALDLDGEVVESDEYGARSWTWLLLLGVVLVGSGPLLSQAASYKHRLAGGWWRVTSERVGLMTEPSWRMAVAGALVVPGMVAILLFAFGLPLGLVYGAFFGLMLLLVVLSFLRRRRLPRRPQAET
jgi:hypothetical protein